jgi:hypothetical protein
MSRHLLDTIRYFNIADNIGYFTSDNATANDTCLHALSTTLANEFGVEMDPVERRVWCGGHIINLCLHAFLFASSKEALRAAVEEAGGNANTTVVELEYFGLMDQARSRRNEANGEEMLSMYSCKTARLTAKQNEAFENVYATIESRAKVFRRFVPLPLQSALKIDGKLAHSKLFGESAV